MRSLAPLSILGGLLGLAGSAEAARAPDGAEAEPALESGRGEILRDHVSLSAEAPPRQVRAWTHFLADAGARWTASWDRATGVPNRIFGAGVHVPGSVARDGVAARHARSLLERHIDLLAPGASADDFVLASDVLHHGTRSVGFVQTHRGMRVLGGQVSFRYKSDRLFVIGSEAFPHVSLGAELPPLPGAAARSFARSWMLTRAARAIPGAVDGPFVLPLVGHGRVHRYASVLRIEVEAEEPLGRWDVYLEAHTGELAARRQTLLFAGGSVRYNAPERHPGADRLDYPARGAEVLVGGVGTMVGADGEIEWSPETAITVVARTRGPLVSVNNQSGPDASATFNLAPGGTLVWDSRDDELLDAQLTAFIHANIAKDFARTLNPNLAWLDQTLPVNVNIGESCNAFSDGNSINFFTSNAQCANTAQLADVVYHEFGHSLHAHSIIEGVGAFDGAHSEGLSDFLSAIITDDPAMGRGFFKSNGPLRHIDPVDFEHRWPEDIGGIHYTGLIFAGAMWDLRKLLIDKYGYEEGAALTNRLYYATLQRAVNIPSTYVEVLAEDDDDGDLENGTPNVCEINAAFGLHGLRTVAAEVAALAAERPHEDGYPVAMRVSGLFPQCPGDTVASAVIHWNLRGDEDVGGSVEMIEDESDDIYVGLIPDEIPAGTAVRYRIELRFTDGLSRSFPDNPADPAYEFYVGEVVPLYCTDFATDPFAEGWTHGLSSGNPVEGADDWHWGVPQAPPASGDPPSALSGDYVLGNDLGGGNYNGKYQSNIVNFASSPAVDVGNYTDVRLQYWRWLTVEDGFFDQASIYSNDQRVWENFDSNRGNASTIHHIDTEWRFHDVRLSKPGFRSVQVKYELASDGGLEFGGWTIDDFCIVAFAGSVCGDGEVTGIETCDDGDDNSDIEPDACRTDCRIAYCGDGVLDSGEECDSGQPGGDETCTATCRFPTSDLGGCGCRVSGSDGRSAAGTLLLAFAVTLLLRRRRRRR